MIMQNYVPALLLCLYYESFGETKEEPVAGPIVLITYMYVITVFILTHVGGVHV